MSDNIEETNGVSIILRDMMGKPITHEGIETVIVDTPDTEKGATFSYGIAIENAEYELDFSNEDQKVTLEKGQLLKEFTINKPETLIPENIAKNINIAGVVGTLTYIEEIETEEAMNALLVAENVGNAYKFIGETTENYINGDIYVVEDNA